MARRGRHRKDGKREANGRLSHVELPFSGYLAAHRVRPVDPDAADEQLRRLDKITQIERRAAGRGYTNDETETLRRDFDGMKTACASARDQNLSFPLGIAYACGLVDQAQYDAGLEYARLYRLVYGRLRDDIEAALDTAFGPAAFDMLLEVGRVSSPAPPASHFRELVASEPSQHESLSPEDYQERREAIGHRYAKALLVLKADFWVHAVVDGVIILGHTSPFLHNGVTLSADDHMRKAALKKGVRLLAEHFGYDKPDRRQEARAGSSVAPQGSPNGARRVREGLDIFFGPERDGRPSPAAVSDATRRLLGKSFQDG